MKSKINWGFFPESPIKTYSIVEIVIVIAIFVGCLRLFVLWYRVPEREIVINVEDLDKNYTNQLTPGFDINPESKYCNIYYKEQQTLDERKIDSLKEDLAIHFHKYKPYYKYRDFRNNHVMSKTFKKYLNKYGDDFEFKNPQALSNFILEEGGNGDAQFFEKNKHLFVYLEGKYIDSLRMSCKNYFADNSDINYVKYSRKEKFDSYSTKTSDFEATSTTYGRTGFCEGEIWSEMFLLFSKESFYSHFFINKSLFPLFSSYFHTEAPSILTTWDISQSYYKFQVNSVTVDSMNIKIDFKGASEFSQICPEPDEIGLSYISYSNPNKISLLKQDGIEFFVKFKDLEGVQQIRLFAMTGIMGGLFTVLIFFIFLYPTKIIRQYKVIRKIEDEKQKQEETKSEESTDEEQVTIAKDDKSGVDHVETQETNTLITEINIDNNNTIKDEDTSGRE